MSGLRRARMLLRARLDPLSKVRFVAELPRGAAVLDVGCGNGSPSVFKLLNPSIRYVGLDIAEHGLGPADHAAADELRFVSSAGFADGIAALGRRFDAVVSAHNIEHVEQPEAVLRAMCGVLTSGGRLYLSFPSPASLDFPSRAGALNFRDDPTHRWLPDFTLIRRVAQESDCTVVAWQPQNRPPGGYVLGALVEPLSRLRGKVLPFTWNYWGFESVVILARAA